MHIEPSDDPRFQLRVTQLEDDERGGGSRLHLMSITRRQATFQLDRFYDAQSIVASDMVANLSMNEQGADYPPNVIYCITRKSSRRVSRGIGVPVKGGIIPYPVSVVALMGWRFGLVEPSLGASGVPGPMVA